MNESGRNSFPVRWTWKFKFASGFFRFLFLSGFFTDLFSLTNSLWKLLRAAERMFVFSFCPARFPRNERRSAQIATCPPNSYFKTRIFFAIFVVDKEIKVLIWHFLNLFLAD